MTGDKLKNHSYLQELQLRVFPGEHNFANKITGLKHNFGQGEGVESHIVAPPLSEDGH